MNPDEAALVINENETFCSACGVEADPNLQTTHDVESYGCGRRFGAVTSDEPMLRDQIERMRSTSAWKDLPWIDRADT